MIERTLHALLGVGLAAFSWVAAAQDPKDTTSDEAGRLQRAPAAPLHEDATRPFDAEAWKRALGASDLDERMARFEELLALAARDPAAREALDAWARGSDELAWSSRLALRELERRPADMRGMRRLDPMPGNGFDSLFDLPLGAPPGEWLDELQQQLDELFERVPGTMAPGTALPPGTTQRSESFQLESTPDGVKARVEIQKDGDTEVKEYEAKSMQELLELYPELREHIQVAPMTPRDLQGELQELRERIRGLRGPAWRSQLQRGDGEVPTDVLGVYIAPAEDGEGLLVDRIEPGTIAKAIGIQRGDVLLEINGQRVGAAEDVSRVLSERKPEQEIVVLVRDRRGEERTLVWKPPATREI